MMAHTVVWTLVLFGLSAMSTGTDARSRKTGKPYPLDRHNVLLPEKVKVVLGLPDMSTSSSPKELREGGSKYAPDKPPRYMRELYEIYRHGAASAELTTGNTVRSIHADIGDVNEGHMFVFNLSSVGRQEKIISAEIHIYRKKSKKAKRKKDPEMLVYEVAPQYMTLSKQVSLHQSSRGWHSVQVTESVRSCLSARRLQPHLLALTFEGENNKGRASLLSLKKFISRHSLPFLIVFSNDTANNITLDHLDPHYGKPSNRRKSSPPKNNPSSLPLPHPNFFHGTDFTLEELGLSTNVNHRLPDTSLKEETNDSAVVRNDTGEKETSAGTLVMDENGDDDNATESVQRTKRSMVDNKIPEEPFDFSSLNFNIPQTHPSILVSREESRKHQSSSKLIPYPESSRKGRRGKKDRKRKRNRKNRRRRRKHNKQSLPLPHEWEIHDNKTTVIKDDTLCSRKKLVVNFADIGWGEWIIAPASFEAHYCAGSCPFPLTKSLRPSNHATIQSIINVIGIRPEVPAPCCVPEVMTSATLLYFDGNKNVVLKNYPHMSVQSCSCR